MKFLLADDSKIIRSMVKTALTGMGVTDISEASDGNEALAALAKERFDVMVLDIMMPGLTGLETLAKIRSGDGPNKGIHVFMVTGEAKREFIHQAVKLGAKGYIVKPFEIDDLAKRIKDVLERLYPAKP
ncbi:MAG: response regulator [Nitrospinae bacterium]|nr:response regulator [Nitrospinota bacterium]